MAFTDHHAASLITEMREARGLSPEALATEINAASRAQGLGAKFTVHPHTIRRIEREGHVPGVRVRLVLSSFFGLTPHELWRSDRRRVAV